MATVTISVSSSIGTPKTYTHETDLKGYLYIIAKVATLKADAKDIDEALLQRISELEQEVNNARAEAGRQAQQSRSHAESIARLERENADLRSRQPTAPGTYQPVSTRPGRPQPPWVGRPIIPGEDATRPIDEQIGNAIDRVRDSIQPTTPQTTQTPQATQSPKPKGYEDLEID